MSATELEARRCGSCGALLSRYNREAVCGPCAKRGKAAPVAPAWLWDSEPLRRALSSCDLSGALKIVRAATGLSQMDFATVLDWSPSQVSRVESGLRDTMYDIRRLLEVVDALDMPRATLMPLIMGGDREDHGRQREEESDMDMNRRALGAGALLGLTAAAGLGHIQVPAKVDAAHIRYFSAALDELYTQDSIVGGGGLVRDGLRLYSRARRMLDESDYTEATARQLMSVAGETAFLVGWLCYDADDQGAARGFYSEAHSLANHAGDHRLAIRASQGIALQLAEQARERQHPGYARQAVASSERAAELARSESSPRLHALLAAREALARSAVGDPAGFQVAISRAWREMDRDDTEEAPTWLTFVSRPDIASHEARGRWYLGNPSAAADVYRTHCRDAAAVSPRGKVASHASLAATLAATGDAQGAFTEGQAVLLAVDTGKIRSQRIIKRLRPVRELAADHARGGDFREHYDQSVSANLT